ncbi:MAG: phosphatase PAP2 family protein [Acidobacteria bacterium]|nr:phosphatase PAP2 family protein [Acidobacteriota bacterium]MBI3428305.1 phosphatase PAP2 family protein [Acidobacteriota bacterium]
MPTLDPILFWNDVALEANRVSHTNGAKEQTGPPLSARALAVVHLAMYDAFAAVANDPANLPAYLTGLPAPPPGAALEAAVAGAAHTTLSVLFPSQKAFFDLRLAQAGNVLDVGHAFGVTVGKAMLDERKLDPGVEASGYVVSEGRGKHRPDPDNSDQGIHAPFYGAKSRGFAITKRHELKPPPFDDNDYRQALRDVRGKGIAPELMGTLPAGIDARTPEETVIGLFWGYDGAAELGTPPRLYNQIVRVLALSKNNTPAENARLFALVNTAMADAGILAWDQKYIHELWRPVVGIREHDTSFGPAATTGAHEIAKEGDPGWLPLGAPATNSKGKNFTPNFPAYPSGHATFGAAALHVTRLFYGVKDRKADKLFDGLTFVSEELNGVNKDNHGTVRPRHVRSFPDGLWQMIEENGRSRVDLGVHWVFDAFAVKGGKPDLTKNIGGVLLGLTIAEDIFNGGRAKGLKKSPVGPRA